MLLPVNRPAGTVLFTAQLPALGGCHDAVGPGPCFMQSDSSFALLQARRFAAGQLARSHAPVNALMLLGLTLVDFRRRQWANRRDRRLRKSGAAKRESNSGKQCVKFHDVSLS